MSTPTRQLLIDMARMNLEHAEAGTIPQVPDQLDVPAEHYIDADRWRSEVDKVFRRLPLMLALGSEMAEPGDFKAITVAGVPVLMVRHEDGEVRAFLNSCAHRGAQIVTERSGNTKRFTCPYHAWAYDHGGDLIAVYGEKDFGSVDRECHGLVALPCRETAGLVWVCLDPDSPLDIDTFLCGYDGLLQNFGFEDWHLFEHRTLEGPNWKIAYDGYMDLYHLPILHRDSFGAQMPNQAIYTAWGPHQRVSSPDPSLAKWREKPEDSWDTAHLVSGVWTIFPHVSIASFDGGGRGAMISQLFPGERPGQSFTTQLYVMETPPQDDEQREAAHQQFKFLEHVVRDEDYATGLRQQTALATGLRPYVKFGRNEAGGQHFHGWLDKLLNAERDDLPALFGQAERAVVHGAGPLPGTG